MPPFCLLLCPCDRSKPKQWKSPSFDALECLRKVPRRGKPRPTEAVQVEQPRAICLRHLSSKGLLQATVGRQYVLAARWGDGCSERRKEEGNPMRRVRSSEGMGWRSRMGTKSWREKEPLWLRIGLQQVASTRKSDVSERADEKADVVRCKLNPTALRLYTHDQGQMQN